MARFYKRRRYPRRVYQKSGRGTMAHWRKISNPGVIPMRLLRSMNQRVHYFKTKIESQWVFPNYSAPPGLSTANVFFSSAFRLSDTTDVANYQTLFDLYRINAVKIKFFPGANYSEQIEYATGTAPGISVPGIPVLNIVFDPDDNTTATTSAEILERPNCKQLYLDKQRSFYCRPKVEREVSDGTVTYGIVDLKARPYIDLSLGSVIHNAVKTMLMVPVRNYHTANVNMVFKLDLVATYYLEFRYPR